MHRSGLGLHFALLRSSSARQRDTCHGSCLRRALPWAWKEVRVTRNDRLFVRVLALALAHIVAISCSSSEKEG